MTTMKRTILFTCVLLLISISVKAYNVIDFGAKGDGVHINTDAINAAIAKASADGSGIVHIPKGVYLSHSIHLKSNVTLHLEKGAVIKAAQANDSIGYDAPEPNASTYQDFGHCHWQNSLLWGIGLENVTIEGEGMIDGTNVLMRGQSRDMKIRHANKALALKECRNVKVQGISFLSCGHFAMLMTGVDNLLIEDVTTDSNRDGFDIDCCKDVIIRRCKVNTLNDDAIVLKCSYALGRLKATENVLIEDCEVSGYDVGTFMDGTKMTTVTKVPDQDGPTGRIKLGTESNGGFRHIIIRNCSFTHCRGLAIESVDGAEITDVNVSNLTMHDICNSPIYIRLGDRMRGPQSLPASKIDGVKISNIKVTDADCRYACLIMGLPGHPVRNVELQNISIDYRGGLTLDDYRTQRGANKFFAKYDNKYPEPSVHGIQPAWGLSVENANGIKLKNIDMRVAEPDEREMVSLRNAKHIKVSNFKDYRK